VVPSKVRGTQSKKLRERSSVILDTKDTVFTPEFKAILGKQISAAFGVQIIGNDANAILNRDTAFFQARTYLLLNKNAGYVEQYEGLYAMMRGFASAFIVGCAYLVGWGLSFHWSIAGMGRAVWVVMAASIAGALIATGFTVYFEAQLRPADEEACERLDERKKVSYLWVSGCMLFFVAGVGYFLGTWKPAPARIEFFLWAALPMALISSIRCLHAYSDWAEKFAEGVWRDFSASYTPAPPTPGAGAQVSTQTEAPSGVSHAHQGAAKTTPSPAHGGVHSAHKPGQ